MSGLWWELQSDFEVDYILPICLPEKFKALTSPISFSFNRYVFKTLPNCIRDLSGLSKLDIRKCSNLVALPQLPGSLLSLDAANCESLKRIDCSFQNTGICLNFASCFKLNQEAKELIQTSACKYAILPGVQVPEHFTHQATSGSLTINLTPRPLPSSFKFKVCILLLDQYNYNDHHNDDDDDKKDYWLYVSCRFSGKQNGLIVQYGSDQLQIPAPVYRYGDTKQLYIFEDSFSLNQDCPKTKEATLISELVFDFTVDNKYKKVKGCGVRLLEVPLDGKQTKDSIIETNNKTEDGGEYRGSDDPKTRSRNE